MSTPSRFAVALTDVHNARQSLAELEGVRITDEQLRRLVIEFAKLLDVAGKLGIEVKT